MKIKNADLFLLLIIRILDQRDASRDKYKIIACYGRYHYNSNVH